MKRPEILLSTGSMPWLGLKDSMHYAKDIGYDGIEIVPSRNTVAEIKNISKTDNYWLKSIHQSWRLDIGLDKSYGIKFPMSIFFNILRLILFPMIKESNEAIKFLSEKLNLPIQ